MPFDLQHARPLLHACNLTKLFVEELGWEPCRKTLTLRVVEKDFALTALAEKRGFTAWLCESPDGGLPDHATRLKLDRKLSETSFEHLIVFVTHDRSRQSWVWVRREPGKPLAARTHEYSQSQPGDSLLQKLQALYVSLEEEEAGEVSTVAVAGRARAAFDIERVTKAFYRDFDTHRKAFLKFIDGIGVVADREWYASVMLNRLMFVYFIQRKGFLDGDRDYLRNRLDRCKKDHGKDKFYTFYRYFLLRLFHEGFGKRRADRAPDLEKLLGSIPYLNGGLFDVHELEKPERYGKDIQIPDQAFERIFDYFDRYQWHLDERPLRQDNEINPDVLGYIFEKFINQKQMGAYYTKEDITEYISKNTVIPFVLDAAKKKCAIAFEGSAGVPPAFSTRCGQDARAPVCASVWDLLKENPDRYIYPAVRHGVDLPLPPEIAIGIDTDGSAGVPPASSSECGQDAHAPAHAPVATVTVAPQDGSAGVPPATASGQDAHAPAHAPFFNPFDEIDVSTHKLPHWNQADCYCFVTWRLDDAMPQEKLAEWEEERETWLKAHPEPQDAATAQEYHRRFSNRLDEWLDAGHGSCVLKRSEIRKIVADALAHFDGQRYELAGYVIMPNHVHVLLRFKEGHALADILHSWKSFTAKTINKALNRTGTLWQPEYWDRLIRNERHLAASLGYIRDNPVIAHLGDGMYTLWSVGVPPASFTTCGQDARAPVAATAVAPQDGSAGVPPASLAYCGQDARAPVATAAVVSQEGSARVAPQDGSAGVPPASPSECGRDARAPLIERRKAWNKPAPAEYALPTEIWREVVARRQRYEEISKKLANGEVREINDFITLNLDLRQFAQDVIQNCEGPDLLMALWQPITTITILDPTGGSGAFIFAALNILDPLYEACLDRMEAFLAEWDRSAGVSLAGAHEGSAAVSPAGAHEGSAGVSPAGAHEGSAGVSPAGAHEGSAGVSPAGAHEGSAGVSPASLAYCGQDARAPARAPVHAPARTPLRHPNYHKKFTEVLARVDAHPNRRYFVLKSIILNNLYAVDIMEEAVEICKLRLFLKLAAQVEPDTASDNLGIEPLPDIDFNIRAGNTLVGFATADEVRNAFTQFANETAGVDGKRSTQGRFLLGEEADEFAAFNVRCADVQQAFDTFRRCQTDGDGTIPAEHKHKLHERLAALDDELNRHLANEYGIPKGNKASYAKWLKTHHPFHWFVQFYGIMNTGGFDVIIGNPPYVEYKEVKKDYAVKGYTTEECGNLYAFAWERSITLSKHNSRSGLIIPVASVCTDGYAELRKLWLSNGSVVVSNFNDRPGKLFDGLEHIRLSIVLLAKHQERKSSIHTTAYNRWLSEARDSLFQTLCFTETTRLLRDGSMPKVGFNIESEILSKVVSSPKTLSNFSSGLGRKKIYYTRKLSSFVQVLDFVPLITDGHGEKREPSELKEVRVENEEQQSAFLCALNSTLFYWLLTVWSDCRNLNKREVFGIPLNFDSLGHDARTKLADLHRELTADLRKNSRVLEMKYAEWGMMNIQCIYPRLSKPIIDEIDALLARHYGFTEEELDFIINYDIKYRMGRDAGSEEE